MESFNHLAFPFYVRGEHIYLRITDKNGRELSVGVHCPQGGAFGVCLGAGVLGQGRGEKQKGHIHYLHTQAVTRSRSRWLGTFALKILGARGQLHN